MTVIVSWRWRVVRLEPLTVPHRMSLARAAKKIPVQKSGVSRVLLPLSAQMDSLVLIRMVCGLLVTSAAIAQSRSPRMVMRDELHPNTNGREIWAEAMLSFLSELMKQPVTSQSQKTFPI